MIPPMKAWKPPKDKEVRIRKQACYSGEYFGQLKIDGSCYVFEKIRNQECYLFSRRVSTQTKLLVEKGDRVPHIVRYLDHILPPKTIIVIEIYYPGKNSYAVSKIMGCLPKQAIFKQRSAPIHAYIHDILMYEGELLIDSDNWTRIQKLQEVFKDIPLPDFITIAETVTEDLEGFIKRALKEGHEGVILKNKKARYFPGTRPSYNFIKYKKQSSYDVLCLGFEKPTRLYKGKNLDTWPYREGDVLVTKAHALGWAGPMKIGVYKGEEIYDLGTVRAGLTQSLLEDAFKNLDKYYMKPLEIEAMEETDVSLREKRFLHFREDLSPLDCTWEKIFGS